MNTDSIDKLFEDSKVLDEEASEEIATASPPTEGKLYDIKWKSKISRGLRLVNMALEKVFKEQLNKDETQILSEEWEDVLSDVLKKGPLILKIIIAIFMTACVVISFFVRVKQRIENTGKTGSTPNDTAES